jgi:hypothetical protein
MATETILTESIHPAWRGQYKSPELSQGNIHDELHVNWLLHHAFGLGGTEDQFKLEWRDKFYTLAGGKGCPIGYPQLNFPDVPLSAILALLESLIYDSGVDHREEVVYKFAERYVGEALEDEDLTRPEWVSLMVLSQQPCSKGRDTTLFGLDMPFDTRSGAIYAETQQYLLKSLIKGYREASRPGLRFSATTLRQWAIAICLDLLDELDGNSSFRPQRVKFDSRMRDMDSPDDDEVAYIFLDENRNVLLSGDNGGRGRKFGFGIMAEEEDV